VGGRFPEEVVVELRAVWLVFFLYVVVGLTDVAGIESHGGHVTRVRDRSSAI